MARLFKQRSEYVGEENEIENIYSEYNKPSFLAYGFLYWRRVLRDSRRRMKDGDGCAGDNDTEKSSDPSPSIFHIQTLVCTRMH